MNNKDQHLFNHLKKAIEATFLKNNSCNSPITDWKGEDITIFQNDLFDKVKGKVSEKWFYTYIKNEPKKLPRIDVLNLLSTYVDYKNWNAFKAENTFMETSAKKKKISKLWFLSPLPLLLLLFTIDSRNTFEFCFIDAIKNENITSIPLDIKILQDNESPMHYKTDSLGCFLFKTKNDIIKFVVQSPYHKTDTIIRNINSNYNQIVKVKPDDYALMLHYYANGNIKDWKAHIKKLDLLIANDAKIYRLFKNKMDIELYSKDEFIRILTIPTKSLKKIEILDKSIENGKIGTLKFIIK
ncbi:hypothetical protein [Lacinutrix sp. Bg11-31]|uniref:hypothetical protein n=1 Tax=Lacinutrix sp. Bg11-31 TaxID=2057808 RepID=UPI000C319DAF|nr:hypothetical protein [Lacinutrix sp. Bg11-31]AUC82164.1 hypothetical protein CW733_08495 [Lacinutrix sp. Bg11-31]